MAGCFNLSINYILHGRSNRDLIFLFSKPENLLAGV